MDGAEECRENMERDRYISLFNARKTSFDSPAKAAAVSFKGNVYGIPSWPPRKSIDHHMNK